VINLRFNDYGRDDIIPGLKTEKSLVLKDCYGKTQNLCYTLIPEKGLEMLSQKAEVEIWQDPLPPPYEALVKNVKGIDGLLCMLTDRIDENLMNGIGAQVKVISQMAVGFDNIDVQAATKRGIPIGNTPDVLTDTTADFAWRC